MSSWEDAKAFEAELLAESTLRETPCGEGAMTWRIWGSGPPLVMLHGGAGSWRHWVLNIRALAEHFTLYVADLPGLGDSADPPQPFDTNDFPGSITHLAGLICDGIDTLIGEDAPFKILAFSFGSINSGYVALRMGARVEHLVLVGAGLGDRRADQFRRIRRNRVAIHVNRRLAGALHGFGNLFGGTDRVCRRHDRENQIRFLYEIVEARHIFEFRLRRQLLCAVATLRKTGDDAKARLLQGYAVIMAHIARAQDRYRFDRHDFPLRCITLAFQHRADGY